MIKSNTFFGSQNFMLHNLQPNKLPRSSLLLQYNGLDFQRRHTKRYAKISFTSMKGIHVNNGDTARAIYVT